MLGEIVHAEGAYIHDLRFLNFMDPKEGGYNDWWRLDYNAEHTGDPYATHGLGPVTQALNIGQRGSFRLSGVFVQRSIWDDCVC